MKKLVFTTTGAVESFCVGRLPAGKISIAALANLLMIASSDSNFCELLESFNGSPEYAPIVIGMIKSEKMTEKSYCKAYELYQGNQQVEDELYKTRFEDWGIPSSISKKIQARR